MTVGDRVRVVHAESDRLKALEPLLPGWPAWGTDRNGDPGVVDGDEGTVLGVDRFGRIEVRLDRNWLEPSFEPEQLETIE